MGETVSIGICAYNEAKRIPALLDSLGIQNLPGRFVIEEVIVVASGCTDGTDRIVEERARSDPRLVLVRESERRGKSSAINTIFRRYRGDFLILVNADARLLPGALWSLLDRFGRDEQVEIACGLASPDRSRNPIVNVIEDTWWRLHNRTLETLSDLNQGNHCCDELMAIKRGFVDSIPSDLINDGAYFGVLGASRGTTVRFCPGATVVVETPANLVGLLRQRQRILMGHRQVYVLLGRVPYTLEGLARDRPAIAARILVAEFFHRPFRTIAFLAFALPIEILAQGLALLDGARGVGYRPAWPMVD